MDTEVDPRVTDLVWVRVRVRVRVRRLDTEADKSTHVSPTLLVLEMKCQRHNLSSLTSASPMGDASGAGQIQPSAVGERGKDVADDEAKL